MPCTMYHLQQDLHAFHNVLPATEIACCNRYCMYCLQQKLQRLFALGINQQLSCTLFLCTISACCPEGLCQPVHGGLSCLYHTYTQRQHSMLDLNKARCHADESDDEYAPSASMPSARISTSMVNQATAHLQKDGRSGQSKALHAFTSFFPA